MRSWNSSTSSVRASARTSARRSGIGEEQLDGLVDLFVEVEAAGAVEDIAVGGEGRGDAGGVGMEILGLPGGTRPRRMVASASRYGARGSVPTLRAVLTRPDSTSRQNGSSAMRQSPPAGADVEPQRVERADRGPEAGGALPELLGGHHVVGHGGDELRFVAPVEQQVPDPFGQDPGLPRPGRGDDPGRPTGMRHRRQLIRRQLRVRLGQPSGGEQTRVDGVAVDHAPRRCPGQGAGGRRRTRPGCRRGGGRRRGRRGWRRCGRPARRATRSGSSGLRAS